MKTALVTGAAGFIGSAVVRALRADGVDVRVAGLGRAEPLVASAVDVDVDVIVHCAGGSSVAASIADPQADFAKTVPPFEALLARVRRARVVLLSSAAVYGTATEVPTPETARIAPVSPYGEHKRRCEELCARAGVAAIVLRLFSVYGPGLRKQLLWDACTKARAGDTTFAGTGDEERDWLHVDDAVALIRIAAEHASASVPIVNGGSGTGARVRDVVGQICRELGAPEPRFTGSARTGDPARYIADITRARGLGWAPAIPLARGVTEYVAWFRAHG